MKNCTNSLCEQENPQSFDSFYKKKNGKFGLLGRCKKCANKQTDAWVAKNKQKKRESAKRWIDGNKEKHLKNSRNWSKNNPGKRNAQTMRRIAAKKQATPPWLTHEQHKEIEIIYIKSSTLTQETGIPHEVDHILPLQGKEVRGLHVPWNLQIVTRSTNRKKNNAII
jgi:hypothetical protein